MHSLVIDARMINASGIGVYLQNIIPYLSDSFKITVLVREQDLGHFQASAHIKLIEVNAPIYSIKEQIELQAKIPACDLFWSPHYNIPLLPIAARKRVVTIHDVYHLAYQQTLTLPQKIYANLIIRAAVKLTDQIITVSKFSKSEITKYTHAKDNKVTVIPNGVDYLRFIPQPATQDNNIYIPKKYLLFVGNVKPHKNLLTLLKAFAILLESEPEYDMLIVGKKDGFITGDTQVGSILESNPLLKKRVIFTGYVEDDQLPKLYQHASLLVFPSVYEGFGLPPLEAMASGCPVVASSAASIPEVCSDAALYFEPQNYQELGLKLKEVLGSPSVRQKLVRKGYENIKLYSWDKAANRHVAVFRQLLKGEA